MENRRIKILAIDDNNDNLISLRALIKDVFPDAETITTDSGKNGFALAVDTNPDVILLDIIMPDMDGFEVCRKLKADEKLADIPVVFVTALKDDHESRIRALEVGAEAFLAKPIIISELIAQIRAMVKIKDANTQKRYEKDRLNILVEQQTKALQEKQASTMRLLAELRDENEARKKSENALRESENRMRVIVEGTPYLFFYTQGTDARVTYISPSVEKITGHSVDEWLNQSHWFVTDNELNNLAKQRTQLHLQGIFTEGAINVEVEHADKYPILLEVFENPIVVNGVVMGLHGVAHDITERKQAEAALRQSNELLTKITDMVPGVVYQYRLYPDGRSCFPISSIGMNTIYEYSPEEVREDASPVFGRLHPDDYQNIADAILESARTLNFFHCEFRVILPRQGLRWRLSDARPERMSDGGTLWYGIISDITERKTAEEQLSKLTLAVQQSPASVIITDIDGNIEYVNPKTLDVTGYTLDELIGKNPRIFSSGELPEYEYKKLWEVISAGNEWRGEFHNKKKDNTLFWESASISPIKNEKGEVIHYLAVKEDITEKKRILHELIKAKENAESANNLKDAFIANISHEIRTPLNGILGMTSIIQESYAQNAEEEDQVFFTAIDRSSKRLINTVDKILNFSRLQVGEFPLNCEFTGVSSVLQAIVKEYTLFAAEKSILLQFIAATKKDTIFADAGALATAVGNVVDNAVKFTEAGSVEIVLYRNINDKLCIDIRDTGRGISEEYIAGLFEPYSQEVMGYSRPFEGLGLGLAIAKKLLNLNGASISVVSKKGIGTDFTICFDKELKKKNGSADSSIAGVKINRSKNRTDKKPAILVVEDDRVNVLFLKTILKKNYRVEVAGNGAGAFELFTKQQFDLILMDISLKDGMNGLELTKVIRNGSVNPDIPIIAVTGHALPEDHRKSLEAGCNDYLTKPFQAIQLLEKIQIFLAHDGNN
ncbi:MAG: response regulator [Ignavibacteriales bacterium]|nr:response regulator [Ignavibacteriales bacterium]